MAGMMDIRDRVSLMLGLREPTLAERLQRVDWNAYVPKQTLRDLQSVDWRDYAPQQYRRTETNNTALYIAAGLVVGVGLAYAMRERLAPAVTVVKERAEGLLEQATEVAEKLESHLPDRLRITRIEDDEAKAAAKQEVKTEK